MRCLALALGLAGCIPTPPAMAPLRTPLAPASTADAELPEVRARPDLARARYADYCARCHGSTGAGDGYLAATLDPRPTDFRSPPRRTAPARAFRAIERGVTGSAMKRFDHVLDAPARWDMAFLVWSWADVPEDIARGSEAFAERCAACHGTPGLPGADRLDDPALAGKAPAELERALMARHGADGVLEGIDDSASLIPFLYTFLYAPLEDGASDIPLPSERR